MTAQFARGPQARPPAQLQSAPHAALLIDFDNVTMGIRSDLTKELKNLLNSDIIKGKVAVQRAYADWRRYPQYIVPLAENSVDLIFAPAYGSSKKNATDIRLAIDALELVFTRSEIGTFILLSGDSDFSSLVLKLKEYGKYVIGVGIRESSSDLLVQNCDEYYSYSGLTGLTRAGDEAPAETYDPWELIEIAVRQMVENRDVMRSDRLKQVLLELDSNFDEKALGFTKFNKFVQEAATRGLVHLKKMENGQFEVGPAEPLVPALLEAVEPPPARPAPTAPREPRPAPPKEIAAATVPAPAVIPVSETKARADVPADGALRAAYELLWRATSDLSRGRSTPIRDSDVKRRMLELQPGFDEGAYGFSKFSRFLRQAHDAAVVNLQKVENGSYEVTPGSRAAASRSAPAREVSPPSAETIPMVERREREPRPRERGRRERAAKPEPAEVPTTPGAEEPVTVAERPVTPSRPQPVPADVEPVPIARSAATTEEVSEGRPSVTIGFRRGSRRVAPPVAAPAILAGQTVQPGTAPGAVTPEPVSADHADVETAPRPRRGRRAPSKESADGRGRVPSFEELPLPTTTPQVIERLASYKGVGRKSAEATVQAFGAPDVFRVLNEQPDRVRQTLGSRRAEQLLKGWRSDLATMARQTAKDNARGNAADDAAPSSSRAPAKRRRSARVRTRKKTGSVR